MNPIISVNMLANFSSHKRRFHNFIRTLNSLHNPTQSSKKFSPSKAAPIEGERNLDNRAYVIRLRFYDIRLLVEETCLRINSEENL